MRESVYELLYVLDTVKVIRIEGVPHKNQNNFSPCNEPSQVI